MAEFWLIGYVYFWGFLDYFGFLWVFYGGFLCWFFRVKKRVFLVVFGCFWVVFLYNGVFVYFLFLYWWGFTASYTYIQFKFNIYSRVAIYRVYGWQLFGRCIIVYV
jgi:hypothetical protein